MKIFVTGATGFIGLNLTQKLAEMGHTVHALCRTEEKAKLLKDPTIKVFYGHIMDKESLETGMTACDAVIHMAAFARVWSKSPGHFDRINIQGTLNVLETARQCAVSRVLITSTAGVFGPAVNDQPVVESGSRAVAYFNDYERTKDIADQKSLTFNGDDLEVITVHPTRVFGPGLISESNAVTTMIKQYISGKWHILPGNGKSVGNYVYVDDVVMGHILALEKGKAGEQYLLGGVNVSYIEFFETLRGVSGKYFRLYKLPYPLMLWLSKIMLLLARVFGIPPLITPGFVRRYHYHWNNSSKKANDSLGYVSTPLDIAMEKTLEWIKKENG